MPEPEWEQDHGARRETWYLKITDDPTAYGYAAPYDIGGNSAGRWHWQAVRGDHRLSGSAETCDDAKQAAHATLSLSVEDFNARVAENLRHELTTLEGKLLRLQPDATLLRGYHAGFEAGHCAAVRLMGAALEQLAGAPAS